MAGYIVLLPDYLGLGVDDKHCHPYMMGDYNSYSGIDMLKHMRSIVDGKRLYISGYSEGAAVAMWAIKNIEAKGDFVITKSAPISGPYDLSCTTKQTLLEGWGMITIMAIKLFLLSYTIYTICCNNRQLNLTDYFVPEYARFMTKVFNSGWSDPRMAKRLAMKKLMMGNVFQQEFYEILKLPVCKVGFYYPLIHEMEKNNIYDWIPKTPMCLIYLPNDELVSAKNTEKVVEYMRINGVERLITTVALSSELNHLTAIDSGVKKALEYFER
jgi:hypothetical protein